MFEFDLAAVLNYRIQIEEQCQLTFSDAMKRVQEARGVLDDLKKERSVLIRHLAKMQENELKPDVVQRHFAFIDYLKSKEENQKVIVCKMEEEADAKRQVLLDAIKKRKVMDALREKKLAEYLLEAAAKERKELDDFSIIKFNKRENPEHLAKISGPGDKGEF